MKHTLIAMAVLALSACATVDDGTTNVSVSISQAERCKTRQCVFIDAETVYAAIARAYEKGLVEATQDAKAGLDSNGCKKGLS